METDTWAVIPSFNEAKNIRGVISEAKQYCKNIILVDDGSKDNTYDLAKKEDISVLRHIVNLGKGATLKTGCDFALKQDAKKIIVLDSDAQHRPSEIPNFVKNLEGYDIVLGYRKRNKEMPFVLRFGNWFINKITKLLYGIDIKDTQCGYRAFTANTYRKIRWKASDYSMESEMIANIGKKHLKYKEIPIKTIYSDKYKGTTIIDGIKIILNMIWWRFVR